MEKRLDALLFVAAVHDRQYEKLVGRPVPQTGVSLMLLDIEAKLNTERQYFSQYDSDYASLAKTTRLVSPASYKGQDVCC